MLLSASVGMGESALEKKPEEYNDIYRIRTYENFVVEKREHYYSKVIVRHWQEGCY